MDVVTVLSVIVGAVTAILLVRHDVREHRLPNRLVALLAATGLVLSMVRMASEGLPISFVLFGTVGYTAPFLLMNLARPDSIGFGDVKLAAALGLFIGALAPERTPVALVVVGVSLVVLRVMFGRGRAVPFAPALVGGAVIALLVGLA